MLKCKPTERQLLWEKLINHLYEICEEQHVINCKEHSILELEYKFYDLILEYGQDRLFNGIFYNSETLYKYVQIVRAKLSSIELIEKYAISDNETDYTGLEFKEINSELINGLEELASQFAVEMNRIPIELHRSIHEELRKSIKNRRQESIKEILGMDSIKDTIEPLEHFYYIVQGNLTNLLPTIRTKGLIPDDYGLLEIKRGNFTLSFSNYNDLPKGIPTYFYQVLDTLLIEFTKNKTPQVRLSLTKYMEMKKVSDSTEARRQVLESMRIIQQIKIQASEKINGKKTNSGSISLYGGTGYIENGIIYFNFNKDFFEVLSLFSTMEMSKQTLSINSKKNPNSYYFQRYIDVNYRRNENKKSVNTIRISTLIQQSPELPLYDDVMKGDRALKRRIIQPTFRDLDILESISYSVYSEDGEKITDPYNLSYEDFINSKIIIDYSKYPVHPERIAKYNKHKIRAEKLKKPK